MPVYLDLVTGKEHVAKSKSDIPGNILNRGLSSQFIEVSYLYLEYAKLYTSLLKYPQVPNNITAFKHITKFIGDPYGNRQNNSNQTL
jgi:hypothetical protein